VTTAAEQRRGRVFVALAAVAWSTAGVMQRELTASVGTQVAGRAVFAVAFLFTIVAVGSRGRVIPSFRSIGRGGIAVGALLAVSSGSFITALNYTSVANILFLLATGPLMAAALGLLVGESVAGRTWAAMGIALAGAAVLIGGPSRPGVVGGGLSFLCALSFAVALVIMRHRRDVSMVPATCLSQLLVLVVAAPFAHPSEVDAKDLALLAALGCQIGLALLFVTAGARLIPAAEVALISLLEIVLGPLWVWLAQGEQPGATTLAGGAIVLAAVALQALTTPQLEPVVPPP
jgi:drug/metabolite transporter (DMT)-like permease